ncbi:hypothetical protein BC332_04772 [Capsicum chinense]|nr:hypothetical protein BC332_04772 [Capsicum chinense]
MKKLRQKIAKKDKKKESGSKKRGHNSPESKAPVKRRRVVEEICRDELPKELSYVIKEIPSHHLRFILRFSVNEFALITGLNCFGNVDDFKYEESSLSRLMKKYFSQSTNGVDTDALVERFPKGNFENKEDALQMTILYFIHTFIYSQLNASPVPFSDFKMVEDGKYQFFPWGKVSFSRLMASLRQEFSMEKQLYRLGGIPQEGNNIPRVLNWKVVAVQPQFNQFMTGMFRKYSYANIVPTADDFEILDLARTINVPQVTEDHDSFDDFSSTPPQFLMRQSIHVSRTVSEPMTKTGKDVLTGRRSDRKKQMQLRDAEKKTDSRYFPYQHILYFSHNENVSILCYFSCLTNTGEISRYERKDGYTSYYLLIKLKVVDFIYNKLVKVSNHFQDVGIEKQSDIAVEEIQPLESIIPGQEHDLALTIYKPPPTTPAEYEISDTTILFVFSTPQKNVSTNKNAPAPRSRKPSKIYRSPFLIHFGSSSKGKKKLASNERKKFSFEGYHITGDSPTVEMEIFEEWIHDGLYKKHMIKKDNDDHYKVNCSTLEFLQLDFVVVFPKSKNWFYSMYQQKKCWNDEHLDVTMYCLRKKYKNTNFPISRYTTTDCFFKVYIDKAYVNYYNSDVAKDFATQDTSVRTDEVADMEKSLINTIKGLSTCAGQPWHMVNEVFVPINCDGAFHWVLAVPTDWTALKSYKEKSERDPFQVEYVYEIAQQDSGSLDCGVFVVVYAEYLSEGLGIPCSGIDAEYHRLRYSSLL